MRTRGFTLVEMLTVLAIISVLAGLTFASISVARRFADQKTTAQEIQMLVAAAQHYSNAYGDYPPTTLSFLKVKANQVNEGNEALVLCLLSRKKGGPFHEPFKDQRLQNGDGDSMAQKEFLSLRRDLDPTLTVPALFEYADLWGNPFVYIHNREYAQKAKLEYTDGEGRRVTVQAARSPKLGTFQAPTAFQIWSFGPNLKNENGDGDDIASWH